MEEQRAKFYLTKRGKIWYVRFRDPATGSIRSWKSTGLSNQARARDWATLEYAKLAGDVGKPQDTLREWSTLFFTGDKCPHESRLKDDGKLYSVKTRRNSRRYLEEDILSDPIADMRMVDIRRSHVLAFRERIVASRGRTRSAGLALQTLRVVIREALERGIIEVDPIHRVTNPAYTEKIRKAVRYDQILALLCAPVWTHEEALLAVLCASLTGLRAGEIRGLQWGDLRDGKIYVTRQVSDVEGTKPPKWGKLRVASYPASLSAVLEPRRGKPGEWVFSVFRGMPLSLRILKDNLYAAAKYAGLEGLTMHGLRHSLNTALRSAGTSDVLIRSSLGWSEQSVQEGYSHPELYDLGPQSIIIDNLLGGTK